MANKKIDSEGRPLKKYPYIGVCGLDCGLCPRYYTKGSSRCPGCAGPSFSLKHPTCSFITCCVKEKNLEVCAECADFPCSKFKSAKEYDQVKESTSYPSYKKALPNLYCIQKHGIESFVKFQKKRIILLEKILKDFDDGRSRSYFCKASIFLDPKVLNDSLNKALQKIKTDKIKQQDLKSKAKILKSLLINHTSRLQLGSVFKEQQV